jgi:hypothetical protein
MRQFISRLFSGHLLYVLTISFALIAILTGVLNTLVISRVIDTYLEGAQSDRVTRDMETSTGLYQLNQDRVSRIARRMAQAIDTIINLGANSDGDTASINAAIDQVLIREITDSGLTGSQAILVLDRNGNIVIGRVSSGGKDPSIISATEGSWKQPDRSRR